MDKAQIPEQIKYWRNASDRDINTAIDLFKTKHYDSCLFFCHLSIEKLLKSLIVKRTGDLAPYIHDLTRLAEIADLNLTEEQTQNLKTITTFNISGRYDNIKLAFYKRCTKSFTEKYLNIAQNLRLWLKKQSQQK